jgi:hypothetical protein
MLVIDERSMLSDGLTPCVKISVQGTTLYIQTDGHGAFSSSGPAGRVVRVRNAEALGDSVVSRSGNTRIDLLEGERRVFRAGTPFERICKAEGRILVRTVGTGETGWLDPSTSLVRYADAPPVHGGATSEVLGIVERRLDECNAVWLSLYSRFAGMSGRRPAVPHWTIRQLPNAIVCELANPPAGGQAGGSTRYLAVDLENRLMPSRCTVAAAPTRITVALP